MADLERRNTFTLLGIRFWDPVQDDAVRDGLEVNLRPSGSLHPVLPAVRNGSGVFSFHNIPGMRAIELPYEGDSTPATRTYYVRVRDAQARFSRMVIAIDLPLTYSGLYLVGDGDPGTTPPGVYLFSAPTRRRPAGIGAVRAQLVDAATGEEAAWAVLEVEIGAETWLSIADENGSALVLFPYPAAEGALDDTLPYTGLVSLEDQSWDITVRVRYQPSNLDFPLGEDEPPELASILGQAAGQLYAEEAGAAAASLSAELTWGVDKVLRTSELSELHIEEV